jgi:hypothetical protein
VIAHLTLVQSNAPIFLLTKTCLLNLPPGRNGSASPSAYGGAFDEIHSDELPIPSLLIPPPHGVGALPDFGTTQYAR